MQAMTNRAAGGLDVIRAADLPTPDVGPQDVRVRVVAAALNHLDLWTRRGMPGIPPRFPHVSGSDVAGVIDEVGSDVQGWQTGDRVVVNPTLSCGQCEWCQRGQDPLCNRFMVLGEHCWGGFAEQLVVPAANLERVPDDFPLIEAAAAPLAYATAWRMLISRAKLRPGETVLVVGAGGGVNSAAIQIAALAGCEVWATTSTPEKVALAHALGASWVVNYREEPNWSKAVYLHSAKRGVDVIVDNVGAATWPASIRTLAKGGRLINVGATTGHAVEIDIRQIFWKQIQLIGSTMSTRSEFHEVMRLVWQRKLKPVIDRVLPLSELREAHRIMEEGEQFGKIVLNVGNGENAANAHNAGNAEYPQSPPNS